MIVSSNHLLYFFRVLRDSIVQISLWCYNFVTVPAMIFNTLIHHRFFKVELRQLRRTSVNSQFDSQTSLFLTLQNSLLDKVISLRTVLESVVNLVLQ